MLKISKIVSVLFLSSLLFSSCEKNIDVDSTPAINATRNGTFFGAQQMTAVLNVDGSLSITGVNPLETLVFNLESDQLGTYPLGAGSPNEAIYVFNNVNNFSSNRSFGRGEVQLTRSDVDNTVSGTFDFVSYLPGQVDSLYMRRGIIYQVPFGDPLDDGDIDVFQGSFTALVNGVGFVPVGVVPISGGGTITINTANSSRQIINLTFPEDITVGMYDFATNGDYTATYSVNGNVSRASAGTLNITAVDATAQTIVGTFNFTAGSDEITEGSFSIEY